MTLESDLSTLGVDQDITALELVRAWRTMASKIHPDKGGDKDNFIVMRQCFERSLTKLNRSESICRTCKNSKRVTISRGFSSVTTTCPDCK